MRNLKPVTALRKLRELFETPGTWIKGHLATIGKGSRATAVHPDDKEATCFCIAGGLYHVANANLTYSRHELPGWSHLQLALARKQGWKAAKLGDFSDVIEWNDAKHRTRKDVLALIDDAIKLAA